MIFNKIDNGVYEIENYIDSDLFREICEHVDSAMDHEWNQLDEGFPDLWKNKSLCLTESIDKKLKNLLSYTFVEYLYLPPIKYINRYLPGDMIKAHRDYWKEDDPVQYGIILYYNDDYTGGEIYYPELDIKIKPKPRSLIIHHGNILHETIPVTDGVRYFSTNFIKGNSQTMVKINSEIGILDYVQG